MLEYIAKTLLHEINVLHQSKPLLLVAIDGRCAAGKSTLAAYLQQSYQCNLFHMDDFFLRPRQRTAKRLHEPGGNVDYERFREEVLTPLTIGTPFSYTPYDCHTQEMARPIDVEPLPINIIEGSYCCHPSLSGYYDMRVFLTIHHAEQMKRIIRRNGERDAKRFEEMWIPLEERYFEAYQIKEHCDLCFQTDEAS